MLGQCWLLPPGMCPVPDLKPRASLLIFALRGITLVILLIHMFVGTWLLHLISLVIVFCPMFQAWLTHRHCDYAQRTDPRLHFQPFLQTSHYLLGRLCKLILPLKPHSSNESVATIHCKIAESVLVRK